MQNLPKPGIYKITCIPTQKVYIGQSVNLKKRITAHRAALISNRHINEYLQRAVNKYDVQNFKFESIEYPEDTSMENLTIREQYWINFFDSMNMEKGFNLKEAGDTGKHSEETKQKISESNRGRPGSMTGKTHTKEAREKISKGNKGKKLGPLSEEHKKKLSEIKKGKLKGPMSEETKRKLSEVKKGKPSNRKGVPMTEETKQKISEANKGKKHTEEAKQKMSESKKKKEETP